MPKELIHQAIALNPESPIPAILHLQLARNNGDKLSILNLTSLYHSRWPDCQQFSLLLAEARLQSGDEPGAVALLHQCASRDAAGQVPVRIWGGSHPYRPLWPEQMSAWLEQPIPSTIAAAYGWNRLSQGAPEEEQPAPVEADPTPSPAPETAETAESPAPPQTAPDLPAAAPAASDLDQDDAVVAPQAEKVEIGAGRAAAPPETLRSIQEELDRLAKRLKQPGPKRADGRFPVYVVFSTRKGLEAQYGPQTSAILIEEMQKLIAAVRQRPGWSAMLFLADDPACTTPLGVSPAPAVDPWKLKLALADLDATLGKRGEMIGALLIVGGPLVVPFHRLPNPTEDADADVASDNPYASLDENYFVPEWPIGRLPGTAGADAGLLLDCLRKLSIYHAGQIKKPSWWQRMLAFNFDFLFVRRKKSSKLRRVGKNMRPSFGYTAAVWKQSSQEVFTPIGEARSMLISPPASSGNVITSGLMPANLGYFNLHGVQDGAEWYGQRDANDPPNTPDYPVALSPQDILNGGKAPAIVFSEACYGANIENKTEEQAIALKFLASGTQAVLGSTCVSYGSVTTPLIAADLLGNLFWKLVKDGQPVGKALQKAKISLAKEMSHRQGYLDGEDQKTLISFVLYGDPLVSLGASKSAPKSVVRLRSRLQFKTTHQEAPRGEPGESVPVEVLTQVKQLVDQYLPGLRNAELSYSRQKLNPNGNSTPQSKAAGAQAAENVVVTLSKKVNVSTRVHRHYAHMTLDKQGKLLKFAVSK